MVLELTESSLGGRDERINSDLAELKDLGVRLAIDEFGTGHSTPGYLRELPIDVIKIDKSFIDAITESTQGRKSTELILDFAQAIEAEVIAEGIETEEQRELLTEMGCRLGQGCLLATPIDQRAAEALLRSGRHGDRQVGRVRPAQPHGTAP